MINSIIQGALQHLGDTIFDISVSSERQNPDLASLVSSFRQRSEHILILFPKEGLEDLHLSHICTLNVKYTARGWLA